jgi:hypothetical protein
VKYLDTLNIDVVHFLRESSAVAVSDVLELFEVNGDNVR